MRFIQIFIIAAAIHAYPTGDQCKVDESLNTGGAGKCTAENNCNGFRICQQGSCAGNSGCLDCSGNTGCKKQKGPDPQIQCQVKETTKNGQNICSKRSSCNGFRTCNSDGFCTGQSLCPVIRPTTSQCAINEDTSIVGQAKIDMQKSGSTFVKNSKGMNKCWRQDPSKPECRGFRTCWGNQCVGESECSGSTALTELCTIDEGLNLGGEGLCTEDIHCKGQRICVDKKCSGKSNCPQPQPTDKQCMTDESDNIRGPNRCAADQHCTGKRYCYETNCRGVSGCPNPNTFLGQDKESGLKPAYIGLLAVFGSISLFATLYSVYLTAKTKKSIKQAEAAKQKA